MAARPSQQTAQANSQEASFIAFPEAMQFLFQSLADDGLPVRYRVAYGGRGGTKSWNFARALILMATQRPLRILCARELQVSIADSVHRLICDQIDAMGLSRYFEPTQTSISSTFGGEFIFTGIKSNITKVKSMEGVDICWVEEAEKVSENSWQVLVPTIRKPGSEIWVSYNPHDDTDPTHQRFVINKPPGSIVRKVSWRDNPWFPEELERERQYLYSIDPDAYEHIWEGGTRRAGKQQVLNGKWVVQAFEPDEQTWHGPYQGADWGFAVDPTAGVRCWIYGAKLYIEHEAYGVGVDINETAQLFSVIPRFRDFVTRGDSSRPETISYLQNNANYGNLQACVKWSGSVEDGVAFLRAFEQIIIHPRCVHAIQEARLWSYKVDPLTNDVLPILVDKHNHIWDAVRYALEPIIKQTGMGLYNLMAELKAKQQSADDEKLKALAQAA